MKKSFINYIIIVIFIISIFLLIIKIHNYHQNDRINTISFFALDTNISISIYEKIDNVDNILNETKKLIYDFEKKMSRTIEGSDLYNINNYNDGNYLEISLDTIFLFKLSKECYELSNKKFDISIGKLVDYWTTIRNNKNRFNINEIEKLLKNVDIMDYELYYNDGDMKDFDIMYNSITIDSMKNYIDKIDNLKKSFDFNYYIRVKNNNQSYDLGAIAKGYIADYIKYYLKENGINSAIINLGGNVLCIGDKYGKDFNIGIKKPFYENDIITILNVKDESVTTSGIYERYIKYDNDEVIYHHIIDNHTGFPINNDLLSATVITPLSLFGDLISTTCILSGKENLQEIFVRIKNKYNIDFSVTLIDNKYNVVYN